MKCLILFIIIFLNFLPYAFAKIAVDRLSIYHEVSVGETYRGTFEVINLSKEPEEVVIYLGDWDRDIDGNNRFFKPGTLPRSLSKWIKFHPKNFVIEGEGRKEVRYEINLPNNAEGTYWIIFFVEGRPKSASEIEAKDIKAKIDMQIRYGIKLYVTCKDRTIREGRVTNTQVDLKDNSLSVKVEFENSGNTYLNPIGKVELRDEKGDVVAESKIDRFKTLPGSKRILEIPFNERLKQGTYIALAIIDFGEDYLVAGQTKFKIK